MSKSASILKTRPKICSLASVDRQRIDNLITQYGDKFFPDLCKKFPTRGREIKYPSLQSAIRELAPSLQELDLTWSDDIPLSVVWLKYQLSEVIAYVGLRDKISEEQKTTLAKNLRNMCVNQHMAVTMAELMVFFYRFEQGRYERFYGYEHANPQIITSSFSTFLDELYQMRIEVRRQMRSEREIREREEWARTAVPMPEGTKRKFNELVKSLNINHKKEKAAARAADYDLPEEESRKSREEIEIAIKNYKKRTAIKNDETERAKHS